MSLAVITGASSGLGSCYVDAVTKLFPEIDELWLIARREDRLKEAASKHADKRCVIIPMDLSDMKQGDARMLRRFYDLNAGELAHWVLYTASDNMAVEELLLVECSSPEQAERVLEAARNRKETQVKNFEGYGPEQVQLLNGCVIRRDGSYVLFAVSDRVSDIKKVYRKDLFQTERTGS